MWPVSSGLLPLRLLVRGNATVQWNAETLRHANTQRTLSKGMGTVIGEKGITTILTNSEVQETNCLQGISNLQGNWKTQREKEIEAIVTEIMKLREIKETMTEIMTEILLETTEITEITETTEMTEMTEGTEIMTMIPEWTQGTNTNTIRETLKETLGERTERMFEETIGKK